MIKATIANIDGSYTAIYDHDDKEAAANDLLAKLIKHHGFFAENRIYTDFKTHHFTPNDDVYGMLLMPGEEDDFDYKLEHANTYWVLVDKYESGQVIVI